MAYHPQSNGMVERWHRSLKTVLRCRATTTREWTEALLTVLLGLRTSFKEDIKASAAELVLGTTLRISGEYFVSKETIGYPQMFVEKFKEYMKAIRLVPTAHHVRIKPFIYKDLDDSTHVFVRVDKSRSPLDQPYERSFPVITKINQSVFRINFKGTAQNINIDRLKSAFLEATQPELTPGPSEPADEQQQLPRLPKVTFAA
ncbi:gag-pol protein [Lasius niger]|uniref:Gag-pol protein n=1 Tax=Lasius niger TaxID=67767 RepID=A0A0J7JWI3_LASNI|nr:gag-pol protein [Lasius niger]